jgi:uncharacterized protein YbjT (DUF2867 family)
MKVILFGGTGMVGQGVLRECLLDERVERVLAGGRSRAPHAGAGEQGHQYRRRAIDRQHGDQHAWRPRR